MAIQAATAAIDTALGVASTINAINDVNTRRRYEQSLANLSFDQKAALNEALINAQSESQRLAILAQVLGGTTQTRINAMAQIQAEKEKSKRYLTLGVILGVVVIGAIFLTLRNK
jgi:hypothetical protein